MAETGPSRINSWTGLTGFASGHSPVFLGYRSPAAGVGYMCISRPPSTAGSMPDEARRVGKQDQGRVGHVLRRDDVAEQRVACHGRRREPTAFDAWQASHITDLKWQRYFVS
jgi:hypothetical protein